MVRMIVPSLAVLLTACGDKDGADSGAAAPEPLVLPDDPAATGVPVGVRTELDANGQTIEIWYPASDSVAGQAGEPADVEQFLPTSITDLVGEIDLPEVPTIAVRDAPMRSPESAYPVIVFSHGFGGFRLQSVDLTAHLASRGYVVVGVDHPGRMLGDVLPCVFSPPLDGCTFASEDPGEEDVPDVLDWLEAQEADSASFLAGVMDLEHIGLTGHSAGGGTTASVGTSDARIDALLPMAAGVTLGGDAPRLIMGGTCDSFADGDALQASWEASPGASLVALEGAGHLAFSDTCALELGVLADEVLAPREDVNATLLESLLALATDGCPGAEPPGWEDCPSSYQDLDLSQQLVRHYSTVFFDAALRAEGAGVTDEGFAGVRVEPGG